jgi:hypothetical protein
MVIEYSANPPNGVSPGTYSTLNLEGTLLSDPPSLYEVTHVHTFFNNKLLVLILHVIQFHYEVFIMCPKCDPVYYDNTETWKVCKTEIPSIRSQNQKHGRLVPVIDDSTDFPKKITFSGFFNTTDFTTCHDKPEIVTKRVAKNNDKAVFGINWV